MVAFKNSTGIKANSSFCTFRFPIAEAHQLTKPFQYQAITTALPTQPFAHFVFMPILLVSTRSGRYFFTATFLLLRNLQRLSNLDVVALDAVGFFKF